MKSRLVLVCAAMHGCLFSSAAWMWLFEHGFSGGDRSRDWNSVVQALRTNQKKTMNYKANKQRLLNSLNLWNLWLLKFWGFQPSNISMFITSTTCLCNVNPGLINPKRLFNWGGYHFSIGWNDFWRCTPLINKPWLILNNWYLMNIKDIFHMRIF